MAGGWETHVLVTEADGTRFPFAEEEEAVVGLDEGRAGAVSAPAANFTGILRLCRRRRRTQPENSALRCWVVTEVHVTVAGAGLQVLHGLTERVALSVVTAAVVDTNRVVGGVFGGWTLTAVP